MDHAFASIWAAIEEDPVSKVGKGSGEFKASIVCVLKKRLMRPSVRVFVMDSPDWTTRGIKMGGNVDGAQGAGRSGSKRLETSTRRVTNSLLLRMRILEEWVPQPGFILDEYPAQKDFSNVETGSMLKT